MRLAHRPTYLLGLSFLYLILQSMQPTQIDPKPLLLPALEPKEGSGNALHYATIASTVEILEKINAASAHHTKIVPQTKPLLRGMNLVYKHNS